MTWSLSKVPSDKTTLKVGEFSKGISLVSPLSSITIELIVAELIRPALLEPAFTGSATEIICPGFSNWAVTKLEVKAITSPEKLREMQQSLEKVQIDDAIIEYIVEIFDIASANKWKIGLSTK